MRCQDPTSIQSYHRFRDIRYHLLSPGRHACSGSRVHPCDGGGHLDRVRNCGHAQWFGLGKLQNGSLDGSAGSTAWLVSISQASLYSAMIHAPDHTDEKAESPPCLPVSPEENDHALQLRQSSDADMVVSREVMGWSEGNACTKTCSASATLGGQNDHLFGGSESQLVIDRSDEEQSGGPDQPDPRVESSISERRISAGVVGLLPPANPRFAETLYRLYLQATLRPSGALDRHALDVYNALHCSSASSVGFTRLTHAHARLHHRFLDFHRPFGPGTKFFAVLHLACLNCFLAGIVTRFHCCYVVRNMRLALLRSCVPTWASSHFANS